ncbi:MAG: hypothetical protein M1831_004231 [Alyxoria varia]|nr:MAG: hypothetical protein M1831_004231 [Alyxoria varia]
MARKRVASSSSAASSEPATSGKKSQTSGVAEEPQSNKKPPQAYWPNQENYEETKKRRRKAVKMARDFGAAYIESNGEHFLESLHNIDMEYDGTLQFMTRMHNVVRRYKMGDNALKPIMPYHCKTMWDIWNEPLQPSRVTKAAAIRPCPTGEVEIFVELGGHEMRFQVSTHASTYAKDIQQAICHLCDRLPGTIDQILLPYMQTKPLLLRIALEKVCEAVQDTDLRMDVPLPKIVLTPGNVLIGSFTYVDTENAHLEGTGQIKIDLSTLQPNVVGLRAPEGVRILGNVPALRKIDANDATLTSQLERALEHMSFLLWRLHGSITTKAAYQAFIRNHVTPYLSRPDKQRGTMRRINVMAAYGTYKGGRIFVLSRGSWVASTSITPSERLKKDILERSSTDYEEQNEEDRVNIDPALTDPVSSNDPEPQSSSGRSKSKRKDTGQVQPYTLDKFPSLKINSVARSRIHKVVTVWLDASLRDIDSDLVTGLLEAGWTTDFVNQQVYQGDDTSSQCDCEDGERASWSHLCDLCARWTRCDMLNYQDSQFGRICRDCEPARFSTMHAIKNRYSHMLATRLRTEDKNDRPRLFHRFYAAEQIENLLHAQRGSEKDSLIDRYAPSRERGHERGYAGGPSLALPFSVSLDAVRPIYRHSDGTLRYHIGGNLAFTCICFNQACHSFVKPLLAIISSWMKASADDRDAKNLFVRDIRAVQAIACTLPYDKKSRTGQTMTEKEYHDVNEMFRKVVPPETKAPKVQRKLDGFRFSRIGRRSNRIESWRPPDVNRIEKVIAEIVVFWEKERVTVIHLPRGNRADGELGAPYPFDKDFMPISWTWWDCMSFFAGTWHEIRGKALRTRWAYKPESVDQRDDRQANWRVETIFENRALGLHSDSTEVDEMIRQNFLDIELPVDVYDPQQPDDGTKPYFIPDDDICTEEDAQAFMETRYHGPIVRIDPMLGTDLGDLFLVAAKDEEEPGAIGKNQASAIGWNFDERMAHEAH